MSGTGNSTDVYLLFKARLLSFNLEDGEKVC